MSIRLLTDLYSGLMDLVYPPFCLVCETAGPDYLCPKCIEQIDVIDPPYCRKCGLPCETSLCYDCREREFAFECARSVGTFDGVLRQGIHALKYKHYVVIADPLGELMARHFPSTHLAGQVDVVVPIPIHRSRLIERGFNQAEELSRRLCAAAAGLSSSRTRSANPRKPATRWTCPRTNAPRTCGMHSR